jgi:cytochrome c
VEQVKVQKEIEGGQLRPNTAPLELISKGETLYSRRCAACHSIDANRVGPMHRGVYGRAAGGVPGFRYSRALKALDLTWTEDTLDKWLTNPTSVAPGTSMGFRLRKPEERKAIIAYLISISDPAENDPVNEPAEK